jgi:hypothetical protein
MQLNWWKLEDWQSWFGYVKDKVNHTDYHHQRYQEYDYCVF